MLTDVQVFAVQHDTNSGEVVFTKEFDYLNPCRVFVARENLALEMVGYAHEWRMVLLEDGEYTYDVEMSYFTVDLKVKD